MTAALLAVCPQWVQKIEVVRVADCIVPGECWLWRGYIDKNGYGYARWQGGPKYTHRAVYEMLVGPIPAGLHIDHLCRQRACCAPSHLEPVTCLVNIRRGLGNVSKTHCPRGHAYEGDNLYIWTDALGYKRRDCRECGRINKRRAKRARQGLS